MNSLVDECADELQTDVVSEPSTRVGGCRVHLDNYVSGSYRALNVSPMVDFLSLFHSNLKHFQSFPKKTSLTHPYIFLISSARNSIILRFQNPENISPMRLNLFRYLFSSIQLLVVEVLSRLIEVSDDVSRKMHCLSRGDMSGDEPGR